jgi:hypothetical protein
MKCYSNPSADLTQHIERMQSMYHPELADVTVGALFVHDDESGDPVLKHQGYPAAAVVSITPLKQRALGVADAVIIVDRSTWLTLSSKQCDALIDHELEHLDRVMSEATEEEPAGPKFDALGRPKLAIRRHDHQLGWFDDVARRHGDASPEIRQAKQLLAATQQLYFDFALEPPPASAKAEKARRGGTRVGAH